jgi:hypothetical protein
MKGIIVTGGRREGGRLCSGLTTGTVQVVIIVNVVVVGRHTVDGQVVNSKPKGQRAEGGRGIDRCDAIQMISAPPPHQKANLND